jgi:hypothetical protein
MDPSPRVVIDIDDAELDASAETVIVWQLSKWGQVPVNRIARSVAGGLVITDYEVPAGVPVTYRVQQFDEDGIELGYALSLAAAVAIPFGYVVMQDPLAPANAVLVKAAPDFSGNLRRSRPTKKYQAGGRTFGMSGVYSAFQQVPLSVRTDDADDREALSVVLEQTMVLVRTPPEMRLPGAFYALVSEVLDDNTGSARYGLEGDLWPLTGDEVSRPTIDILVPIYSYDRFKAYLDTLHPPTPGTYDDAAAVWATYIDALRNPPPEV